MLKKHFLQTLAAFVVGAALSTHAAPPDSGTPAPAEPKPLSGTVKVTMETSKGTIELELDADKAPISVNNFVNYAKKGFYDGTIFHRVIPGFMIQGGGFTENMEQKPAGKSIPNESKNGLKNDRGTIAMARTSDPSSATAQFFINVANNDNLNYPSFDGYGYAVFGKVTKGMDVVDAIVKAPTTTKPPFKDVPQDTIKITKVTVAP
jgi:cyclophilin family peptidyl-prolyl cis-trans isomerase